MRDNSYKTYFQQLFSFLLFICILSGNFAVFAQKRRTTQTKTNQTTSTQQTTKCSGGWSGSITFEKTLNDQFDDVRKNVSRGTTALRTSRIYRYAGRITVDGSQNPTEPQTKTQISLSEEEKSFKRYAQMDTCFYDGKGRREQWGETTDDQITKAFGEGAAESFNLNVNPYDGTYSFSFRFPDMQGTYNREAKIRRGGWCQPKNNLPEDISTASPTKIDGTGTTIDDQKIDPKNPDVLAGSKCWDTSSADVKSFKYVVTWSFRRCPSPLEQLRPSFMQRFNRAVRKRQGTKFSVLVGNPLPQTCQSTISGDGVVEIPSAIWEINDYRYAKSVHTDLTSQANFDFFVWRRLAISWRGDHKPDTNYKADYDNRNTNEVQFVNAAFNRKEFPVCLQRGFPYSP